MANRNGTGPSGAGPKTGRGMGKCDPKKPIDNQTQTFGQGRGKGQGRGLGLGQSQGSRQGKGGR